MRADIGKHGKLDCVLVDEAQFLTKPQVWQLSEIVDTLRIPVLCYGLRTDFRGRTVRGQPISAGWADELTEIKTICHSGKKATMTVRVDAQGHALQDGPQVEIGGNDRYVSVSRAEYKKVMRGEGRIDPLGSSRCRSRSAGSRALPVFIPPASAENRRAPGKSD